ncbi:MAG: hypothetical protein KIG45_00760 [Bacteroidales bacterium]|nr:hypothetical protein [Bacteroidales bacterium]
MGLYDITIKPIARKLEPQTASRLAMSYYKWTGLVPGGRMIRRWIHKNRPVGLQRELFGLNFYNPVGLSSGLDLNAELYNDLSNLGFSFTVVGPLGRKEIAVAVANIQKDRPNDIIAACIDRDYVDAFSFAYDFFDFFIIDLGEDDNTDIIDNLLDARLLEESYKPIVIRLGDGVPNSGLEDVIHYCMMNSVDGIELRDLNQIKFAYSHTLSRLPIISDTRINCPEDAQAALEAGASLVEVREGLLREGPSFINKVLKKLLSASKSSNKV